MVKSYIIPRSERSANLTASILERLPNLSSTRPTFCFQKPGAQESINLFQTGTSAPGSSRMLCRETYVYGREVTTVTIASRDCFLDPLWQEICNLLVEVLLCFELMERWLGANIRHTDSTCIPRSLTWPCRRSLTVSHTRRQGIRPSLQACAAQPTGAWSKVDPVSNSRVITKADRGQLA